MAYPARRVGITLAPDSSRKDDWAKYMREVKEIYVKRDRMFENDGVSEAAADETTVGDENGETLSSDVDMTG